MVNCSEGKSRLKRANVPNGGNVRAKAQSWERSWYIREKERRLIGLELECLE